MNLDVRFDNAEALAFFAELDSWAVQYIADNAERIFKRAMTREQVPLGITPVCVAKTAMTRCSTQKSRRMD